MNRCQWVTHTEEETYHDTEWGVTSTDEQYLFEMLVLEGMQAGLSWITILKKRANYKQLFYQFDIEKVAKMTDAMLEEILTNEASGIIRNRSKVYSIRSNAIAFLDVQKEFTSFYAYIWSFIPNQQKIINDIQSMEDVLSQSPLSEKISKDLKKRGFKFVGPVILYSYLQAIGVIDDHENTCSCKTE